jgi:hypothetical protein
MKIMTFLGSLGICVKEMEENNTKELSRLVYA